MAAVETYELVPTGSLDEVTAQDIGQAANSALTNAPNGTTLILYRDADSSMHAYVSVPGSGLDIAKSIASGVQAKAILIEDGLSLNTDSKYFSRMRVRLGNRQAMASTSANIDPAGVVRVLAEDLQADEWVAVALRNPIHWIERAANERLYEFRGIRQHQSAEANAKVGSMYAGSPRRGRAHKMVRQAYAAMPGLDVIARPWHTPILAVEVAWVSILAVVAVLFAVNATAISAAVTAATETFFSASDTMPAEQIATAVSIATGTVAALGWVAVALAILFVIATVLRWPLLPAADFRHKLSRGLAPCARRKYRKGKAPQGAHAPMSADGLAPRRDKTEGAYPTSPFGFFIAPQVAVQLVTPHGGAMFTATSTRSRGVPKELREVIGPVVGEDEYGLVRISAADLFGGIFASGEPGSGKSYLLESVWGWMSLVLDRSRGTVPPALAASLTPQAPTPIIAPPTSGKRTLPSAQPAPAPAPTPPRMVTWADVAAPSPQWDRVSQEAQRLIPGLPGQITPVGFDTKLDAKATASWSAWSRKFGVEPIVLNIAQHHESFGVELFPMPDGHLVTPMVYAESVVDGLIAAFGEDAIGDRSRPSLLAVFESGALFSQRPELLPESLAKLRGASPWAIANILIGNTTTEEAQELADAMFSAAAANPSDLDLADAATHLAPIYGSGVSASVRRQLLEAPRNKISPLMVLDSWWSRPHRSSWIELLDSGRPVILNFGTAPDGRNISEKIRHQFATLTLYSMRRAIEAGAIGWQEQGKLIPIFADEVKHLSTGENEQTLTWFRADGRAFGVSAIWATQMASQLTDAVFDSVLGYVTQIAYRQASPRVREQVASVVSGGGVEWAPESVEALPPYTPIIKTVVRQRSVPGFVTQVPPMADWSPEEFANKQLGR